MIQAPSLHDQTEYLHGNVHARSGIFKKCYEQTDTVGLFNFFHLQESTIIVSSPSFTVHLH